jgi:hypothetical protein|tara:strand:- start:255 stop:443 length:189 start_codon:yes stop_codon:yes gene_type:complete
VARYTVELHQEDAERLPMMRMGMEQSGNPDWDLICDILQQIENQEFQNLIERMNIQRGMTKE